MKKTAPKKDKKTAPETPAKNRHGGARPGAGRKKGDGGRIAADIKNPLNINFSFSLSKKHLKKLKDFAKKNKLSASKVLQNFIENL